MISIVIPLYNKRETVARALRSVLGQTVQELEVVVVDDGSTDGSADIVLSFAEPRIRIITQPNSGVSAARNRGIREASSEMIAFLDADDEWLPTFLESILALRSKFPECGIYATSYFLQGVGGQRHERVLNGVEDSTVQIALDDYFLTAAQSNSPVWSSAVAVRKEDLSAVGCFPVGIKSGEDLLTWSRLAARKQVALFQCPLAVYHQDPVTVGGCPSRVPDPLDRVGAGLRDILLSVPVHRRSSVRKYIGLWYKMRGSIYLRMGNHTKAISECGKALVFWPLNPRIYILFFACALPGRLVRWVTIRRQNQ